MFKDITAFLPAGICYIKYSNIYLVGSTNMFIYKQLYLVKSLLISNITDTT